MRIYYLDAPLRDGELEQLRVALCGAAATPLEQVRLPFVFPATEDLEHIHSTQGRHLQQLAIRHLQHAGVEMDVGRQIGWVEPRNTRWSEIFQTAIQRLTGYYPIAIQRWRANGDGTLGRAPLCVMDMEGMQVTAPADKTEGLVPFASATLPRQLMTGARVPITPPQ